ncbi:MAG: SGNH/GDSL hydrolase family protein [Candidatus Hydrogenedentes bacterium]|jgi:lysophospholipase L1-like esterase|nr:SGNH/GDSL hydrolase family protein [Candidatus Hydrogenedentota bacterium]
MQRPRRFLILSTPIFLILFSVALVVLPAELVFRIKDAYYPVELSPIVEPHPQLGWQGRRNYRSTQERLDSVGRLHEVTIATDDNGFRQFGGPNRAGCRVFFIGDSYTFAEDADQSESYYALVSESLGLDAFAYGAQGFSTLQEYLILDEWLEQIAPDLVVLQFCHNDFINNSFELTRLSAKGQCHVDQPYLSDNGKIIYKNPGHGSLSAALSWIPSRLLRSLAYRIDNRHGLPSRDNTIENLVEEKGRSFPLFEESVQTTERLLRMVKERCGDTPLLVFTVDCIEPYFSAFNAICANLEIAQVEGIAEAINEAAQRDETVFAADQFHWTGTGHGLCAAHLERALQEKCGGEA